jgi:hypothetical protein
MEGDKLVRGILSHHILPGPITADVHAHRACSVARCFQQAGHVQHQLATTRGSRSCNQLSLSHGQSQIKYQREPATVWQHLQNDMAKGTSHLAVNALQQVNVGERPRRALCLVHILSVVHAQRRDCAAPCKAAPVHHLAVWHTRLFGTCLPDPLEEWNLQKSTSGWPKLKMQSVLLIQIPCLFKGRT